MAIAPTRLGENTSRLKEQKINQILSIIHINLCKMATGIGSIANCESNNGKLVVSTG